MIMENAISFTEEHMALLLMTYDAFSELKEILQMINQGREDEGIIGRMGALETLLTKLSPVYDGSEDVSARSLFWHTVLDAEGDLDKRVKMLTGM